MPTHHTIDYIELYATDMEAAKLFFGGAFGWEFNDYGPDYAGIKSGPESEQGGLARVDEVAAGGSLVVLYSDDLSATLAAVEAAGGKIVTDILEFPGGRRFQFIVPGGNEMAVWGAATP